MVYVGTNIATGRYHPLYFNSNSQETTGLRNYDNVLTGFLLSFLYLTSIVSMNKQNSSSWRADKAVTSRSICTDSTYCILAKLQVPLDIQHCASTLEKHCFTIKEANFMT